MKTVHALQTDGADRGVPVVPCIQDLPRADLLDPVVEAYKKDVDRTLLRANLALTVEERMAKFQDFVEFLDGLRSVQPGDSGGSRPRP